MDNAKHRFTKKRIAIIVVVVVAVLAAAGACAWYVIDQHNKVVWEQEHQTYPLNITIQADGYDPETSSPIPVLISGTDFEDNIVSVEALIGTEKIANK